MTWRELPPSEWSKLTPTEAGSVYRQFDPETTRVVVVEQDGAVVGTWVLLRVIHAECVWIADPHRKQGKVARFLLSAMARVARSWGAQNVMTAAVSEDVEALIERIGGVRVPGSHFVVPVTERT